MYQGRYEGSEIVTRDKQHFYCWLLQSTIKQSEMEKGRIILSLCPHYIFTQLYLWLWQSPMIPICVSQPLPWRGNDQICLGSFTLLMVLTDQRPALVTSTNQSPGMSLISHSWCSGCRRSRKWEIDLLSCLPTSCQHHLRAGANISQAPTYTERNTIMGKRWAF